jgi:hypothetical protein
MAKLNVILNVINYKEIQAKATCMAFFNLREVPKFIHSPMQYVCHPVIQSML